VTFLVITGWWVGFEEAVVCCRVAFCVRISEELSCRVLCESSNHIESYKGVGFLLIR